MQQAYRNDAATSTSAHSAAIRERRGRRDVVVDRQVAGSSPTPAGGSAGGGRLEGSDGRATSGVPGGAAAAQPQFSAVGTGTIAEVPSYHLNRVEYEGAVDASVFEPDGRLELS